MLSERNSAPLFGVAGFPPNFHASALRKRRENIFGWLHDLGLDWIELQCTYGVKMPPAQARRYRQLAEEQGVGISIHGPYYITLASGKPDVVARSRERILQCFALAERLGSQRVIFHPGFFPGTTKEDRRRAVKQIIRELRALEPDVPQGMWIYPETAGKRCQIGSLDEIIEICEKVGYARPCVDVAHIHGFEQGALESAERIEEIFCRIRDRLGADYLDGLHAHMYPISYGPHGEKKHEPMTLDGRGDAAREPAPRAEDFVLAIKRRKVNAVVVCEAHDTQDIGARRMKRLYEAGGQDGV